MGRVTAEDVYRSVDSIYGDDSGRARLTRDEALRYAADINEDNTIDDVDRELIGQAFDALDTADGSEADGVLDPQTDRVGPGHRAALQTIEAVAANAFESGLRPDGRIDPARMRVAGRAYYSIATLGSAHYRQVAARGFVNLGHTLDNEAVAAEDDGALRQVQLSDAAKRQFDQARVLLDAESKRILSDLGVSTLEELNALTPEERAESDEVGRIGLEAWFYDWRMQHRLGAQFNQPNVKRCALAGMSFALEHIRDRIDPRIAEATDGLIGDAIPNQQALHELKLDCGIPSQERDE